MTKNNRKSATSVAAVTAFFAFATFGVLPAWQRVHAEQISTIQQPFLKDEPRLVKKVKEDIFLDICGAGLPDPGTSARQAIETNLRTAVLAWIEPMRIFGSPLIRTVNFGYCGSNARTRTTVTKDCYFDIEIRKVICDETEKEEKIPPDLNVSIEISIPSGREYFQAANMTIYMLPTTGYPVVLHEVGHAFGLLDTYAEGGFFCDIHHGRFAPSSTSVMCNANFTSLQLDDIAGVQSLYCDAFRADCTRRVMPLEKDTDRPGGDYSSSDITSNNHQDCYTLCADSVACKAFTFVPSAGPGSNSRCYLKDRIPASKAATGLFSGYKP